MVILLSYTYLILSYILVYWVTFCRTKCRESATKCRKSMTKRRKSATNCRTSCRSGRRKSCRTKCRTKYPVATRFPTKCRAKCPLCGKMPTTRFPTNCRGAHRFVGTGVLDGPSQAGIKNNAVACGYRARLPLAFASFFAVLSTAGRERRSLQFYTAPVPTIIHVAVLSFIHHSALARGPLRAYRVLDFARVIKGCFCTPIFVVYIAQKTGRERRELLEGRFTYNGKKMRYNGGARGGRARDRFPREEAR